MITLEQAETARTPEELRRFVAEVRAQVEANPAELQVAREKKGIYKTFVDEIIPLAQAADYLCGPEDRLQPVLGNQGYDAIVLDKHGSSKGKVEIGKPYDGKAVADDVKLLKQRGFGKVRVRDLGVGLLEIAARIVHTAKDKSIKDYSDCTLMIVGAVLPPMEIERKLLSDSADDPANELRTITYKAKKVIFVVPALEKCYEIQG
jgi:hypothetical protein